MDTNAIFYTRTWAGHKWREKEKQTTRSGHSCHKKQRLPPPAQQEQGTYHDRSTNDRGYRIIELAYIKKSSLEPGMRLYRDRARYRMGTLNIFRKSQLKRPGICVIMNEEKLPLPG